MKPPSATAPSGQVIGFFVAAVLLLGPVASNALRAQIPTEPPVILPSVKSSAGVPVVKVADYHLLEVRWMATAVAKGNYIYVIGGLDADRQRLTSIERFDVRTGKSEIFAHLNIGRRAHRSVLVGDKIYVLGGSVVVTKLGGGLVTDRLTDAKNGTMPEFGRNRDPSSEFIVRQQFRDLDRKVDALAQAADDGYVPGVGKQTSPTGLSATVEIIDLARGTVSRGPDMPEPRMSFSAVLRSGKIYVVGGQRPYQRNPSVNALTNTAWVFDVSTGQWSAGVNMPTPRDNTDGVLVDGGVIVVPGGYDGINKHDEVEVFNPADGRWRTLPPLCKGVSAASVVFFNHYLLLFGDFDSPRELISYDLVDRSSNTYTLNYKPARHTAAVTVDGKIYVIGGMSDVHGAAFDYVQVYAPPPKTPAAKP